MNAAEPLHPVHRCRLTNRISGLFRSDDGLNLGKLKELIRQLESRTSGDAVRLATLRNSTLAGGRVIETRRLLEILRAALRRLQRLRREQVGRGAKHGGGMR